MPLLIDGHNLIAQVPGLSLADAEDEADLVMLLRGYITARRGRRAVVVFDHGVYGHPQRLDGYGVKCYFARSPQDADEEIIRRLRTLARPRDWTLVTSDRRVAGVATARGIKVISSEEFARWLVPPEQPAAPKASAVAEYGDKKPDVRLSAAEVEEWLRIFGAQLDEQE